MEGRRPEDGRYREGRYLALSALALAALLGFFLRGSLAGGKVLSQLDVLLQYPPWREVAPGHVAGNPLLEDQALLMVPWLEFAAARIRAGELPLWNPYNYGGQPIHAANSGAFLWPVNFLYYAFPSHAFYAWSALLRLLAAGVFSLLYLRGIGVSRAAALPAALAFSLCGFLVVWLNHPHSNVALTLPAHLWLLERLAARRRWRDGGLFALAVGAQLLGGHSQTSLHLLLVVAAYALFRALAGAPRLGRRACGIAAAGAALGFLLAAPQLLPLAEYLKESRGVAVLETLEQTDELDAADAAIVMVAPGRHGGPHTHDYSGPSGRNLNYNEIAGGYVGRLMLLLALAGLALKARDPHVRFFGVLVVLCALVAWQVWPVHDAFRRLPRLRSTNPTRLLLYVAFGLAVLGAFGLDELLRRLARSARGAALAAGAVFLGVGAELVAFGRGYNPEIDPALVLPPTPTTDFLGAERGLYRALAVEQTTLRAAANLHYRVPMLTGYDKIEFRPMAELFELLAKEPAGTFLSEVALFDRIEALPLASALNVRFLLSTIELEPPLVPVHASPGGVRVYENPLALPRAFAARGVRVLADRKARLAHLGSSAFDPWTAILSREPDHPAYAAFVEALTQGDPPRPGAVEVLSYEPRRVALAADLAVPGLVVLADTWDPGWSAWVNGEEQPIERVDHALRGVWAPAGRSAIEFRYAPASFRLGAWLGAAALGGTLALLCCGARGKRAGPPQDRADSGRS